MSIGIRGAAAVFRRSTGIPLGSVPVFAAVGAAAILATAPALFRRNRRWDGEPVLGPVLKSARDVSSTYVSWTRSDQFTEVMPVLAQAATILLLILPTAALVRSMRTASKDTATAAITALALGVFSLPLVLWAVRVAFILWSWYQGATGWLDGLSPGGGGGSSLARRVILFLVGAAIVIGVLYGMWVSSRFRRWTLVLVSVLVISFALFRILHIQDSSAGVAIVEGAQSLWHWVTSGLLWAISWLLKIALAVIATVLVVGVLAQIGTTFWLP